MSKPSEKEIASDPGYNRPYIPLKRPLTDKIKFDPDYELLLASEREARRQLLAPPVMLPPDILKELGPTKFVDPYVARELHLQEKRDKELRDLLDALLGKASDWRSALCVEARHNDYARGELGRITGSNYAKGDTREAGLFLEALKAVDRLKTARPGQDRQGMGAGLCDWLPREGRAATHAGGSAPIS